MAEMGWIKLHRGLLNKPIWKQSTPEQKTVLIVILMLANHSFNEWEFAGEKYRCEAGQFVTSLNSIAEACGKGISVQNVRTALARFEKLGFLTNKSTKTGRLITIVNWGLYQGGDAETNKAINKELTKTSQSTNKDLTTNKNDKNDENVKNKNIMHSEECNALFEKVWSMYPSKKGKGQVSLKAKKNLMEYGEDQINRALERYKQDLASTPWRHPQNGSTFFNSGIVDYLDTNYEKKDEGGYYEYNDTSIKSWE